ncbi:N-formylglutamate amidohydrolase [Phenylobacterium sp.]|uniref:N-formylglutamate amidohydrolase n=1 Tax=Phenylobacterium sp. TaxID=1871053 RepID=UPI0025D00255|nr:N-formylglutamate amidohydrolase [Phenylobacterium sp.]
MLNPGAVSPFLLLGDHAGREIPRSLAGLGLPKPALDRHIAWDIGIAAYGALLSRALDAAFIRQRFSRLVIDCNRDPSRPDAVPEVSDDVEIPGNLALSADARHARVAEVARPYHAAIAAELDRRVARGLPTTLISLHSFTPRMNGLDRPWRFGVLHADDSPYSRAILDRLRAELGQDLVGDNQPYRMDEVDFTVPVHAGRRGLDYLELEVRQDLLADAAGQAEIAALVARLLPAALADL